MSTKETTLYKKRSTVERILIGKENPKIYSVQHYWFGTYDK